MITLKTLYLDEGISHLVEIECDSAPGIPGVIFSGRAGKIIEESAIRVKQAIRNVFNLSFNQKILINLIPSDIKKNTNLFDLPLAIAILAAINKLSFSITDTLILGELSLSGQIKINHSVIPHILRAKLFDFKSCIIPEERIPENLYLPVKILKVKNLFQCWQIILNDKDKKDEKENNDIYVKVSNSDSDKTYNYHKSEKISFFPININKTTFRDNLLLSNYIDKPTEYDFKFYRGGKLVKRALTICAAGFHSIYLLGPSGTGKTLLSTMFKDILPPLLKKEEYELIDLYSQYNIPFDENRITRPYRTPHHSSTITSIVGGGSPLSLGEVTLAHNGVLVLDEINLFNKKVLESLREPFEEQKVMICRSRYKIILPSSFILFLISNLCSCGNCGSIKRVCTCNEEQRRIFLSHVSNALKDRIDIIYQINEDSINDNDSIDNNFIKNQVIRAFEKQFYRYLGSSYTFNAKVYKTDLNKYIKLDGELETFLFTTMKKIGQSFRRMEKVIKVARTIADIENHKDILKSDLIESIFYVTGFKS
ncbi:MAG: ATP-binding protein [Exilispira sp.]